MGEENRVENQDKEGYRSLWEMLQGPVRNTDRFQSITDFETPDNFLSLLRVG